MNKVLLIGDGASEHALAYKLSQSPHVAQLIAAPGNPGISEFAKIFPIEATEVDALVQLAKEQAVDFVVIGKIEALIGGLSDALTKAGIPCLGPNKACAKLESSRSYSKDFMARNNIPTAPYQSFDNANNARIYLAELPQEHLLIKTENINRKHNVFMTKDKGEAFEVIDLLMVNSIASDAGNKIIIETFTEGDVVSLLLFSDGKQLVPMLPVAEHKRIGEGETGHYTNGMGTCAPAAAYTTQRAEQVKREIITPLHQAMQKEALDYRGILNVNIMFTESGPIVTEFNVRFGEPEAEVLLPLLSSDLFNILRACAEGSLDSNKVAWRAGCAMCVVIASGGYPEKFETDCIITDYCTTQHNANNQNTWIFHGDTTRNKQGRLVTSGGRVITVSAVGKSFEDVKRSVYERVHQISFKNCYFRTDIGQEGSVPHHVSAS